MKTYQIVLLLLMQILALHFIAAQDNFIEDGINEYNSIVSYPECSDPAGFYTINPQGDIKLYLRDTAKPDVFYYTVNVSDINGDLLWEGVIEKGNTRQINGLLDIGKERVKVEIQKACYRPEYDKYFYSEWVTLPEVASGGTNDEFCDMFNGGKISWNPSTDEDSLKITLTDVDLLDTVLDQFIYEIHIDFCDGTSDTISSVTYENWYILPDTKDVCGVRVRTAFTNDLGEIEYCDFVNIFGDYNSSGVLTSTSVGFGLKSGLSPEDVAYLKFLLDRGDITQGDLDSLLNNDSSLEDFLKCGDSFTPPNYDSTTTKSLDSLVTGDVLKMFGFSMDVIDMSGSDVIAILHLPFHNKHVEVNLTQSNIEINQDNEVIGGSIVLTGGDVQTNNTHTSQEYCNIKDPEEDGDWNSDGTHSATGDTLDPNGFTQSGTYKVPPYPGYEEGDTVDLNYDPCGFNANGEHVITGTLFNESGCSQNGFTQDSLECTLDCGEPYYWLKDPKYTEDGSDYYKDVKGDLDSIVNDYLDSLQTKYDGSIAIHSAKCDSIRSELRTAFNSVGGDSAYVYGSNSEYINKGLANEFVSKPSKYNGTSSSRNSNIVKLEKDHVALYECDLELNELDSQKAVIDELISSTEGLLGFLENKIKQLTKEEVENLKASPNNYISKIRQWIVEYIDGVNRGIYGFQNPPTPHQFHNGSSFTSFQNIAIAATPYIEKVVLNSIKSGSYKKFLVGGNTTTTSVLPLSLVNNSSYKIFINKIVISTSGATLDAYCIINTPSAEQIVFAAEGVAFNPTGLAVEGKLSLKSSEVGIKLTESAKLVLESPNTYVTWDCKGFKEISISGYIEFCEDVALPIDSATNNIIEDPDSSERVRASFKQISLKNLSDFFMENIDVDPFASPNAKHIIWTIKNANLDFSDIQNPDNFAVPLEYESHLVREAQGVKQLLPYWRGFYLEEASALVKDVGDQSGNDLKIAVHDLIIDDHGFTGSVEIKYELLSLDTGSMGGWAASIDSFNILIVQNKLRQGGFSGKINVPILNNNADSNEIKEEDCFAYSCQIIGKKGMQFTVTFPQTPIKSSVFIGEISLNNNSTISIERNDKFTITAILNGELTMLGKDNLKVGGNLTGIKFQKLTIRNHKPYIEYKSTYDNVNVGLELGGFSLFSNIAFKNKDDSLALKFSKAHLGLGLKKSNNSSNNGIIGSFDVIGILESDANGRQIWKYHKTKLYEFGIDLTLGGTHIAGGLSWYENDSTYGNGFKGVLKAKFNGFLKSIDVVGQFGRIDDGGGEYSYFMVDAMARLSKPIPIIGPLELDGFGGGLSYHMSRSGGHLDNLYEPDTTAIPTDFTLGNTLTGINYVPDEGSSIHFKLNVEGLIKKEDVCRINAEFGIAFNSSDHPNPGIDEIYFKANAVMMKKIDFSSVPVLNDIAGSETISNLSDFDGNELDNVDAKFKGYILFQMKFGESPSFDATAGLFVEAGDILNGRALAELHISKDKWYFNLGRLTPDYKLGDAKLEIDLIVAKLDVETYLNIGTDIPPMPELPREVRGMFPSYERTDASLGTGDGFAFGLHTRIGVDINFWLATVDIDILLGFDLAMKKYKNVYCLNNDGIELGFDGWYSTGQVYAYIGGKLVVAGITILNGQAGAYLQFGFPNPSWFKGEFALRYGKNYRKSISGDISYGKRCIPSTGDLEAEAPELIWNIIPGNGTEGIDPNKVKLEVFTSFPLKERIEFNGTRYVISIDSTAMYYKGTKLPLKDPEFSVDKRTVYIAPQYGLPSNDTLEFIISFKVLKNGTIDNEALNNITDTVMFTTSAISYKISEESVIASYPIQEMKHFLYDEYEEHKGYIVLSERLFHLAYDADLNLVAEIKEGEEGTSYITNAEYVFIGENVSRDRIEFNLPPAYFKNSTDYHVKLHLIENNIKIFDPLDLPLRNKVVNDNTGIDPGGYDKNNQAAKKYLRDTNAEAIYTIEFSTSEYKDFESKLNAMGFADITVNAPLDSQTLNVDISLNTAEVFDKAVKERFNGRKFKNSTWHQNVENVNKDVVQLSVAKDKLFEESSGFGYDMKTLYDDIENNHFDNIAQFYPRGKETGYITYSPSVGNGTYEIKMFDFESFFSYAIGYGASGENPVNQEEEVKGPFGENTNSNDALKQDQNIKILLFNEYNKALTTAVNTYQDYLEYLDISCQIWKKNNNDPFNNGNTNNQENYIFDDCPGYLQPHNYFGDKTQYWLDNHKLYPSYYSTVEIPIRIAYKLPGLEEYTTSKLYNITINNTN